MTYQIISERRIKNDVKIVRPDAVYQLVKRYEKMKQEQLILLTLSGARNVISVSIISIGLVNKTIVHPREIFCKAISDRAAAIIICHNHPSNSLEFSYEDKEITKVIQKAGNVVGIPLIDHIVFSRKGYTSQRENGDFPKRRQ